ncbi:transposase [Halolactibacillus alkaliphilus]|uniref:Transposase n=1 Tax=Halolactibacillus alkaliphilus TaxID=442899 RepID=A0A511WXW0_9BACI|nr:RNA-guided endonuclease TnpB family protein [Halolactibacillus alkaliphilus]GEN55954.1 transposase [Halolactibacillus alkaliphilus]GGN75464.1 transposase [Halolactibacillus alkaliphilus]SFO68965.1 putative transposase [Halolactibacillus alkaliphilus]
MILARKIRIKPTEEQEKQLWKSVGVARWVYNWTLDRQRENYDKGGKFLSDSILRKEITQIKQQEDFKWLGDVSNNVAKQAVKDACDSYKRFFKGLSGFPKFKSKKKSKPSFYNDNLKLKVKKNLVLIEKVGWIKTSEQIPMGKKYSDPRVSHDGKYWYLSVGIEREVIEQELTEEVIGIDLGVKDLAVCSNGKVFKNINKTKEIKKIEKRLRRLQRSVSRKYEMNKEGNRFVKTCNIIKIEKSIQRLHRRLNNIRNNHIHQATNTIVKTKPSKVVMEDLNISGMMKNRHLAKSIAKQKLYEFIRQMKYKCEKNGIKFIQVQRFFPSSKTCSDCGQIKSHLKLSDRLYKCDCGLEIDRDLNASLNLANYGKLAG